MDRRLFDSIFSDAQVVDVDLSSWDKSIDIYVLADHLPRVEGDRLPLFQVRFIHVRSLVLVSSAFSVSGLAADEHVQWTIDDSRVEQIDGQMKLSLWGFEHSPQLEITCEDVVFRSCELRVFDRLFPGWDRPSAGLARPGPLAMMELLGFNVRRSVDE
jgi:hypothetical protein